MRVVFFGTPYFAKTILEYLVDHGVDVVAVITKPDKPMHRSSRLVFSAVKQFALERQLPCFQPLKASDPSFIQQHLEPLQADVFVVAAFSEILKENLLAVPKIGCINVHASLLPKYRGAAPIERCIMAGERQSGVTIMAMDRGLDTGGMYHQVAVPISEDMVAGELYQLLAAAGAEALLYVLQQIKGGTINPVAQPQEGSCYAKKLTTEDAKITWNHPSQEVYNHIRAVTPKPGAWCDIVWNKVKKRLLIHKARHLPNTLKPVGTTIIEKNFLAVACQTGAVELLEVQLEGKKRLSASAFLQGVSPEQLNFFIDN